MKLEITSAAGTKYQFIEVEFFDTYVNAYSWYDNRWNRLTVTFKTLEEAQRWVIEIDKKHDEQNNTPKTECRMSESSYYTITGYYGD